MKNFLLLISMLASTIAYAETVPTAQAKKHGVTTCAPLVEVISKFAISGNDHGSEANWNKKNPMTIFTVL